MTEKLSISPIPMSKRCFHSTPTPICVISLVRPLSYISKKLNCYAHQPPYTAVLSVMPHSTLIQVQAQSGVLFWQLLLQSVVYSHHDTQCRAVRNTPCLFLRLAACVFQEADWKLRGLLFDFKFLTAQPDGLCLLLKKSSLTDDDRLGY